MNQKPTIILTAVGIILAFFLYKVLVENVKLSATSKQYEKLYKECLAAGNRTDTIRDTVAVVIPRPYPIIDSFVVRDTIHIDPVPIYRRYKDSIPFEDLNLTYDIGVVGTLEELGFEYKILKEVKHEIIYRDVPVIEPEKPHVWVTAFGSNKDVGLGGLVGYKKVIGGYSYGIANQSHNLTFGYRIY